MAEPLRAPIQIARHFNRTPLPLTVRAIAASGDDFLWLATDEGLFRFDGIHFHLVSPEPATYVAVTADGWVLAGGETGLVAFQAEESRRLLSDKVSGLVARGNEIVVSAGKVWHGTARSLLSTDIESNGSLSLDAQGRVWFGCGNEVCALALDGHVERWGPNQGLVPDRWLGAIADDAGTLWAWSRRDVVSVAGGRIRRWNLPRGSLPSMPPGDFRKEAFRSHSGRIWIDGRLIENGQLFVVETAGQTGLGQSFAEDRFGNVWQGSQDGLNLVSPTNWARTWRGEAFLAGSESITRTVSGRLLASTATGVSEFDAQKQQWNKLPGVFGGGHAWSVIDAPNEELWAIIQDRGIFRLNRKGEQKAIAFAGSMRDIDFRSLFRDRSGEVWVGSKRGLYRVDESASAKVVEIPLPGDARYVGAFATDKSGQEWLGSEGGIARLDAGQWKLVVPPETLLSPRIRSLAVAPGPVFWVSYRAALPFSMVYQEGSTWKRRDFGDRDGYQPSESSSVLVDSRGWVWRGTSDGLFVSDGKLLAPESWLKFDRFNGLASDSVGPFGLFEDSDGAIWVSSEEGVARIAPDSHWFSTVHTVSPPRVTRIRWDGKEHLGQGPRMRLSGGPSSLEVDFSQWPEPLPHVQPVQFRLWPLEKDWKTTSTETARYELVPRGTYRFDVKAGDAATQSFELQIGPSETVSLWWSFAPLAGTGGGIWWVWRRIRRSREAQEYLKAKQAFVTRSDHDLSPEPILGDVLAGRYKLEERIGDGGFATVYRALDVNNEVSVAIKIYRTKDEFPDLQRRRFAQEVESLRRIEHPGIVRMLDSGWLSESEPFLVMEYVSGPNLRMVLDQGPLKTGQPQRWIVKLGEALGEAHARGVLHRDLKPENILVHEMDTPNERVVIVDFGAAVVQNESGQNGSTVTMVSRYYAAPERVRGHSSTASDVYSLATIVFEMLTGIRFATLLDGDEADLRKVLARFPNELVRLFAHGADPAPARRPKDIRAFAKAVASTLDESRIG